jgi:Putative 2OG-Fe(II) oxygenase
MDIIPEYARDVPIAAQIGLLEKALQENPTTPGLGVRLAGLLMESDQFAAAISVLERHRDGPVAEMMRARSLLARDAAGDVEHALSIMRPYKSWNLDRDRLGQALSLVGKIFLRAGLVDEAKAALRDALDIDPANESAFKRLVLQYLREGDCAAALALTEQKLAEGYRYARLFAAKTMALTAAGRPVEARAFSNMDDAVSAELLRTPAGWSNLAEFNNALVHALESNPAKRFDRYGTASLNSWRIDEPARRGEPVIAALLQAITDAVIAYSRTSTAGGLWRAAQPSRVTLRSWAVLTGAEGHEQWHTHPDGWLSGGYYPEVPASVENGNDAKGCFEIGMPGGMIGETAANAYGSKIIRPKAGLLTLFPSHLYHRTHPHGTDARRICIAFDLVPA